VKLRLLADDLTGALDSAAAFEGLVPVYLDAPPASPAEAGGDAVIEAVATATRDVPPDALPALLEPSLRWLRGGTLAFKKVDSLLRGNTFIECAFVASAGFSRLVFAPAFPQQGRTLTGGRAWRRQPGSADVVPIIERSIAESFAESFAGLGATGLWVPEVQTEADLRALAAHSLQAAARDWLWCGSAGLAQALAAAHGRSAQPAPIGVAARPVMLVSASWQPVIKRQWERLRSAFTGSAELALHDLAPPDRLSADEAAAALQRGAGEIVATAAAPGSLVVVGGDTLRALLHATGARSLLAEASPRAGWGRARIVGGRWDGVPLHSRSGAFGDDDDLLELVAALMSR
jgi:uncharacterized protein YgbK (DUF1537 family)